MIFSEWSVFKFDYFWKTFVIQNGFLEINQILHPFKMNKLKFVKQSNSPEYKCRPLCRRSVRCRYRMAHDRGSRARSRWFPIPYERCRPFLQMFGSLLPINVDS